MKNTTLCGKILHFVVNYAFCGTISHLCGIISHFCDTISHFVGPLFFHPTSPFLPHTHNSPTSLLSPHLATPSLFPLPTHVHTQLPNLFSFFYPTSPSPHALNFQPTQCNQEYCSIHIPLCPRVYDQGDMIRGGNSLDWPITLHL